MPKVSVIVPIYNTEAYLEKCLQSLVSQTLSDLELIWVDNGANQACKDILSSYEHKRPNIKVLHLEQNIGYGGAMNTGLNVATGEYVGFCDSDDWVDSDFYERLYVATQQQKHDIAYAEYKHEYETYSVLVSHHINTEPVSSLEDKLRTIRDGAVWDKIFRRQMLVSHGISFPKHSKSYFEDNIFLIQAICHANSISLVTGTSYHYLQRQDSTIHKASDNSERETYRLNVIAYAINYAIQHHFSLSSKIECLKFLNRSLNLFNIIKSNEGFKSIVNKINSDSEFMRLLSHVHFAHNPTFFQRIFSIQNDLKRTILWICGLKIKLKNKEKK